ncbi:MAG: hypothetical protein HDR72_03945 [Ruminococcaceae bacterium]|nr:hypothetical protein [Oscillospiraceae bacterium]
MKFSKIASAAAAIAAAGMMTVSASAIWVPVKDADKAEKLHTAVGASWMVVPFFDGVAEADQGKPVGGIDGLDYSKIAKISCTFSVAEEDRDFWDGAIGGALVLSMNGGDLGCDDHKSDKYDTYNWVAQEWWGVDDEELGIVSTGDEKIPSVKVGDYTYKVTSNAFENPLANGDANEIGLIQVCMADYAGTALCQCVVEKVELLDASDNVLVTFDDKGNYTVASGSSTPAPDKTDDAAPSTPGNVDTGVEGVAAVVGVAALAAGAVVLSRKRK